MNKINKAIKLALLGLGTVSATSIAVAEDIRFTPRIGLGMQKYKLEWAGYANDGTKLGNTLKVDEYMPTLTVGGTVAMGGLYLDAYWQQTGTSDETHNTFERPDYIKTDNDGDHYYNRFFSDDKAKHKDYAISLGYGLENGLTFFGGYKYGKADVKGNFLTSRQYTDIGGQSSNFEMMLPYRVGEKASFETKGPFLGLGYGLNLGSGVLSLTGAIAWLDGKTKYSTFAPEINDYSSESSKPSATGLALSLAWKAPINKQLSYAISLDSYQYNYDKKTSYYDDGRESIPLKVKEESIGMRASLSYSF